MKVLITGAEGFVGKELVKQCKAQQIDVISIDLIDQSKPNYHKADIRSKDIVNIIPEGIDAIIHLAGLTRDPDCRDRAYDCFDANVMATLNLIEAANKKNANQFIFASSEWVYGSFKDDKIKDEESLIDITTLDSEYAFSKLVCESNLRQKFNHGFCPVTVLRLGIIYGPRKKNWSAVEAIFNNVKTQDEIKVGSLKTGRCFINVADIASGIIKSIGLKGYNIINLQGDNLITLNDIIETSKNILNKDPKIIETAKDNVSIRNISNKKAKNILAWQPEIKLEEGLNALNEILK